MNRVPLTEWKSDNPVSETMGWKDAAYDQFSFFGVLPRCFMKREEWRDEKTARSSFPYVIGTHTSKSITLPVVEYRTPSGIVFTIRENFYDYKISVKSPHPIRCDFDDLFDPTRVIHSVYFEGFPKDRVYGSYQQNPQQFSVELTSEGEVYVFMWLVHRSSSSA